MCYRKYTKKGRLADVIRLISVLAIDKHTFRSEKALEDSIRGRPISANNWFQIADEHPEFFRLNGKKDLAALLLRSYLPIDKKEAEETREPIGMEETQKMIDVAISLYDKEISKRQSYAIWSPLIAAIIGAFALGGTTYYTVNASKNNNDNIRTLQDSLQQFRKEIRSEHK